MITAKPVIADKFWILEEDGSRVGTLNSVGDKFVLNRNGINVEIKDKNELSRFGITWSINGREQGRTGLIEVLGYPTDQENVFHVENQKGVPTFTKTAKSQVRFAAGYWGIRFPKGWVESFCPKLTTLESYTKIGPFKSAMELKVAIQREKKND